mmetsp:Transcript_236/g.74  ORF Transcript_236/g.74 Transcript_236/m.74 type:complete len:161 (-) Transcript_236:323-805(-)
MEQSGKIVSLGLVIIIGLILQSLLIHVDSIDTPRKAALEFINAYYKIDSVMAERLCKANIIVNETNLVEGYIQSANAEAEKMGYSLNYMKHRVFHIEADITQKDVDKVEVRIKGYKDRAIRAIYPFVARIFHIGEVHEVNHILNLKKESGKWVVCDFALF